MYIFVMIYIVYLNFAAMNDSEYLTMTSILCITVTITAIPLIAVIK